MALAQCAPDAAADAGVGRQPRRTYALLDSALKHRLKLMVGRPVA